MRLGAARRKTIAILPSAPTKATQKLPPNAKLGRNNVTMSSAMFAPLPTANVVSEARVFFTSCCNKTLTNPKRPPAVNATNMVGRICSWILMSESDSSNEGMNNSKKGRCQS